ncbi:hypothetical protein LBMAG27_16540 [Bacteroidota bacterium]|nr:hypothetical protein LBMAG27_16540 [Bacteroidota bacterium]
MGRKNKVSLTKRIYYFLKKQLELRRYKGVETYELKLRSVEAVFSTTDAYSKGWFFPRYDKGKYHEPTATNLFIDEIKPEYCVFDIGTNLGFFTCISGKLAAKGSVHSFEVDENCILLIEKNCRLNGLSNVTINNCAVSDNDETEKIPVSAKPNPRLKVSTTESPNLHYIEVKALQIDTYIKQKNLLPDFIKIDVEGAELKVLKGMVNTLKKPQLKLLIEVHVPNLKDYFNTDYKDLLGLLFQNGFSIKELKEHRKNKNEFREINGQSELHGNTMIYAFKS